MKSDEYEESEKALLQPQQQEKNAKTEPSENEPLNNAEEFYLQDENIETETDTETNDTKHEKPPEVKFLDGSKDKSDFVIDLVPCVNKVHCVVFNDIVTPHSGNTELDSLNSPTELKSCLDNISLSEPSCRVCHCTGSEQLISPCDCSGSVKWVHETCLVKWMKSSFKESCELCRREIEIAKRRKPLSKWKLPSQRPTPVLWVLVFITAIALNLASVVKDASRECSSTPCIVFYAVGCIGVVLGTLFLIYWSKRAKHFINQWLEQNEEWVVLLENMEKRDGKASSATNIPNLVDVVTNIRT